jgi:3-deoxy-D-manno-octulosonic-acid transferase
MSAMAGGGVRWLYRGLMAALVPVALPLLTVRDRLVGKRRPPWSERLVRRLPSVAAGGLWIQAVSVGEVEIARRLIRALRERAPDLPITVTATTATGLELARSSLAGMAAVAACPLDTIGPVSRFCDQVRPRALILVETELWPEMLSQAGDRGIPVAVVNARLSARSAARYRRVRALLRPLLEPITLVLTRDVDDARRFQSIGVAADRITAVGNIKYDLEADPRPLPWRAAVEVAAGRRPVVVAGSTMEGEEAMVLDALAEVDEPRPLLVLAPRHPERFDAVAELVAARGLALARRSRLDQEPPTADADVFLLDTIGELSRAYALARVAFIGGSLVPTGGHNPLEPLAWGVPVVSGPHVHNFAEVYRLLFEAGAARCVDGPADLAGAIGRWLSDPVAAQAAGSAGEVVVRDNRGATERTASVLLELVDRTP